MDIMSGRLKPTKGYVTVNGLVISPGRNYLKQGYVSQSDILMETLTPEEILSFSAILRLPNTMTREQKLNRAQEVLRALGLKKAKDTRIGGVLSKGISGGEKKRVCIGIELLTGNLSHFQKISD